jgi:hypothetical protein
MQWIQQVVRIVGCAVERARRMFREVTVSTLPLSTLASLAAFTSAETLQSGGSNDTFRILLLLIPSLSTRYCSSGRLESHLYIFLPPSLLSPPLASTSGLQEVMPVAIRHTILPRAKTEGLRLYALDRYYGDERCAGNVGGNLLRYKIENELYPLLPYVSPYDKAESV